MAGLLRGASLVTMTAVDPGLAAFHAARLVMDRWTDSMSGEPAITAVRVLAASGETLALCSFLFAPPTSVAEVVAEALRATSGAPSSIVSQLVGLYGEARDEAVLLGLFDLLLGRPDVADHSGYLLGYVRESPALDMCRYLAAAIVAGRVEALIPGLREIAAEVDGARAEVIAEALALLGPPPDGR